MATSFQLDVEVLGGRDSWVPEEEEEEQEEGHGGPESGILGCLSDPLAGRAEGTRPEAGTRQEAAPPGGRARRTLSPERQRITWWEKVRGAGVQPTSLCSYTLQ